MTTAILEARTWAAVMKENRAPGRGGGGGPKRGSGPPSLHTHGFFIKYTSIPVKIWYHPSNTQSRPGLLCLSKSSG